MFDPSLILVSSGVLDSALTMIPYSKNGKKIDMENDLTEEECQVLDAALEFLEHELLRMKVILNALPVGEEMSQTAEYESLEYHLTKIAALRDKIKIIKSASFLKCLDSAVKSAKDIPTKSKELNANS